MRTVHIDPDYRREPKTDTYCCRCQKDIKNKVYRVAHLLIDGITAVHNKDCHLVPDGQSLGLHAIGNDCAKKIGIEFTHDLLPPIEGQPMKEGE